LNSVLQREESAEFQIIARGGEDRPRRILKYGDTFAVLDSHGAMGVSGSAADGLFRSDTRYLSAFEVLVFGMRPLLLGSNVRDNNLALDVDLTNPDIYADSELLVPKDTVHIRQTFFVYGDCAFVRLGIRNHSTDRIDLPVVLLFGSDFADIFEVRGMRRKRRGVIRIKSSADATCVTYRGLDGVETAIRTKFEPTPDQFTSNSAKYSLNLAAGEQASLFATFDCGADKRDASALFLRNLASVSRDERKRRASRISLGTSSDVVNQTIRRAFNDLAMLVTETPHGLYPYAGTPWFSTIFGRDAIITALGLLWCQPHLAKGVLLCLADLQATESDPLNDAQPGKIIHEMRSGEMARLREVPFGRYYGSVDATPLFVLLAARYYDRTGDLETVRGLWPNIERALSWINGPGDFDQDGFVEYQRATPDGLRNQGWKDAVDSVFHADGPLAHGPIALAEVQAYVHAAKLEIAQVARALGEEEKAQRLESEAAKLFARFNEVFWCNEIGCYALAVDGDKRPCRVRTSNTGHVLFGGLATIERAKQTERTLLGPDMLSGWGIRTVARGEARYNPMSYHNGSIWPHDNALIAAGFRRYGNLAAVETVATAIFGAASHMELMRLPELYCGFRRVRGQPPTSYPVACAPQAWASAAPFYLLDSLLGFEFETANHRICLSNPILPEFIDMMVISNLEIQNETIDFGLFRSGSGLSVQVFRNTGNIQLSIEQR